MLLLQCHAFTTMPYFLLLYQPITTNTTVSTYLDYLANKSHLHKNLNVCLLYLRNNLNVIKRKGRNIVWSMNPLRLMPQETLKQIQSAKG